MAYRSRQVPDRSISRPQNVPETEPLYPQSPAKVLPPSDNRQSPQRSQISSTSDYHSDPAVAVAATESDGVKMRVKQDVKTKRLR